MNKNGEKVMAQIDWWKAAGKAVTTVGMVAIIAGAYALGRASEINLNVSIGQVDFFVTTAEAQTEVKRFVATVDKTLMEAKGKKVDTKAPPPLPDEKKGTAPQKQPPH